jgi:flagellar biosynthesis protein FlhA
VKKNLATFVVPVGVVGIVLLLVVPIPAFLLDILLVVNIMFALVILLTTMFVKKPLDFSVFPSLLLVATLFRLGLNVASAWLRSVRDSPSTPCRESRWPSTPT